MESVKPGLHEGSSGRWEDCGWLGRMGTKTGWACKDLTEGCPRLLCFVVDQRHFLKLFFFFNSTFISYLLGLTGNTGVIVWASF